VLCRTELQPRGEKTGSHLSVPAKNASRCVKFTRHVYSMSKPCSHPVTPETVEGETELYGESSPVGEVRRITFTTYRGETEETHEV
jgi:hypothetical protein